MTTRHYQIIESVFLGLEGSVWSLNAPVFLFDRCWLRLDTIRLDELRNRLPPDITAEAPELIRYNQLLTEKQLLVFSKIRSIAIIIDNIFRVLLPLIFIIIISIIMNNEQ